ncbi:oligoendopeptidase F [Bacteroidota bacterium]
MKRILSLLVVLLLLAKICEATDPKSREEIPEKYKWNLNDIYPSWEAWEADLNQVDAMYQQVLEFKGNLGESDETYLKFVKLQDEMSKIGTKLRCYVFLNKSLDGANPEFNTRNQQLQNMYIKNGVNTAWIAPELKTIPKETAQKWLKENPELKDYKFSIEDFYRQQKHILPEEKSQMMTLLSKALGAATDIYSSLSVADMVYPKVTLSTGEEVTASPVGVAQVTTNNTNQSDRKLVTDALRAEYAKNKNTYTDIYSGILNSRWAQAQIYDYNSCLESALSANNIPTDVYLQLIEVARNNTEPLKKYSELRKKALKLDPYYGSDNYVSLTDFNKSYTWEEAEALVREALKPLGDDYNKKIEEMLSGGKIDVYEAQGKRGGAFNLGVYGVHPYILMNYGGTRDNVFTLVHELGHSAHSLLACENQAFVNHSPTIFVAEVASTFNENLLLDYMIKKSNDPNEKIALLVQSIDNITGTFYRQVQFAEFEYRAYTMIEQNKPFNAEVIATLYDEIDSHYYGDIITKSENGKYSWPRVHHFLKRYYYVYQYATSFAASSKIYMDFKNEKDPKKQKEIQDRYLNLLKSGGNEYPVDQLAKAGIDMTNAETYQAVTNQLSDLVNQLENELKAIGKI